MQRRWCLSCYWVFFKQNITLGKDENEKEIFTSFGLYFWHSVLNLRKILQAYTCVVTVHTVSLRPIFFVNFFVNFFTIGIVHRDSWCKNEIRFAWLWNQYLFNRGNWLFKQFKENCLSALIFQQIFIHPLFCVQYRYTCSSKIIGYFSHLSTSDFIILKTLSKLGRWRR